VSSVAIAALAALLVVAYTYAGYPLLVALWARVAPRRVREQTFVPTVSICLAVHDGERDLARKLSNLQALDYPADRLQFLVFSDGSTDATERILHDLAARDPRIVWLGSPERVGKPTALNRLLPLATGEVLLLCDVRQLLAPSALRELLRLLSDPSVGCVSGSLVLAGAAGAGAYWRYERLIRGAEGRIGGMVGVSGSLYAIRRADMPPLPSDVLLDDMFVPLRVVLSTGKRVTLAEAAEAYDTAFDDDREFGRKIRTIAGNYQLLAKMPELLLPRRNPLWFQLVSHKLLRLVCPWALVVLFVATAALALDPAPSPAGPAAWSWRTLLCAECAFGALALLGRHAGRLGTLARTFVVLNAAAVVGFVRFLRGSQAVTW
jgi:cellulose synthase/poly-beta-1,6-N-acetylglucosamine synthase-like glycosyltransferase